MTHVLIIDDDPDIREVAQLSFEVAGGWQVQTAESGQHGIDAATRTPPDVILLDYMMPEMDGPTTLKRLREHPATRNIPVFFLTARTAADLDSHVQENGAQGLLAKPFDPLTLADELAQRLGAL